MKTVSLDQLRKQALATGAELEVGGKTFNSARAQISAPPPAPVAPLPPLAPIAPPPEPGMTRAEVAALIAERDAVWRQQIDHLTQTFGAALKAMQPAPKGTASRVVKFNVTYDDDKCVTGIVPVYAH